MGYYMRVLNLSVLPSDEVRFVVAVKAVIRRIICQGGLNSRTVRRAEHRERLHELEEIDRLMQAEIKPKGTLGKLVRMERKQARIIAASQNDMGGISTSTLNLSSRTQIDPGGCEYRLVQEVAAAKIQRRLREAIQRRRER